MADRVWSIRDFDPKTDPMVDCSSVEVEIEGYDPAADEDNQEVEATDGKL